MLRIYPVLLELVVEARPLVERLERRDADLARQCRRALASAPLNVAEGSYSRGKNRAARYHTALGSLREALAAAGIRFEHGLLESEARELNIGFVSRMTRGRPWVRMKIAATLDGRTALPDGKSQWITGAEARRDGHRWRARACAILTGIGTVRADDPRLTVREVDTPRQPLRVIVDSRLETPRNARILQGEQVLVFSSKDGALPNAEIVKLPNANHKVELPAMLEELARRGINELHVEAGFRLNGSLAREGCVDEYLVYLNPSFLGDAAQGMLDLPAVPALDKRLSLRVLSLERLGEDLRILARPA